MRAQQGTCLRCAHAGGGPAGDVRCDIGLRELAIEQIYLHRSDLDPLTRPGCAGFRDFRWYAPSFWLVCDDGETRLTRAPTPDVALAQARRRARHPDRVFLAHGPVEQ